MRRPQILPLPHTDPAALHRFAGADDADLTALLGGAARVEALFRILCPELARLHLIGAVFCLDGRRFSATGVGLNPRAALAGCLGEVVETLSQSARPGEDAVRATRLSDGETRDIPAALALRLPDSPPGVSLGCAAGPSRGAAIRAATLELAERDALARDRPLPVCDAARAGMRDALTAAGRRGAVTALHCLQSRDGTVTALAEAAGAQGAAADPDPAQAARRAALELCAAEAGARLSAAAPAPIRPQRAEGDLWAVDLTRPEFDVAVVKVLALGLSKT